MCMRMRVCVLKSKQERFSVAEILFCVVKTLIAQIYSEFTAFAKIKKDLKHDLLV